MDKFNKTFSKIFKFPEAKIADALTPKDVPEWDSMSYLLFIAELEKDFNLSFTMNEVIDAKTLGDIRMIVEKRKK